jgi:RNA polymerase sigma factor (sigma-70 family)
MATGLQEFIARLRGAIGQSALTAEPDANLLRRYAAERDEVAFAELVRRHAPAVYAVCRRQLSDSHTLDDAFQAVFVVLSRKAAAITKPELLAGWLHGVADRVARKARARQAKQAGREYPLGVTSEPFASSPEPEADLRVVLEEELRQLPPEYREAVMLCDVDGLSRRAAAKHLGIPDATLSNRLARARAMLGRRLLRRGVALGTGLGTAQLADAAGTARFIAQTVECAFRDTIPSGIESLVIEGLHPMLLSRKLLAVLIVAALGAVVGGVILIQRVVPLTSPSDSVAARVITPSTRAMVLEPGGKKPWPKPKFGEMVTASAFSRDRKLTAMVQDYRNTDKGYKVVLYDSATWKEMRTLRVLEPADFIRGLALTADGKRAFIGGDNIGVHVWDTHTDKLGKRLDTGPGKSMCRSLRLSPDGKLLAANLVFINGSSHGIRVWDAASGEVVRTISVPKDVSLWNPITFADAGATVAGACDGDEGNGFRGIIEWDVKTGTEKRRFDAAAVVGPYKFWRSVPNPFQVVVQSLSYTADGKSVVVGGGYMAPEDQTLGRRERSGGATPYTSSGHLWVIDRVSGKLVKTLIEERIDLVRSAEVTAGGKKLIVTLTIPTRTGWAGTQNKDSEFIEIQQWDTTTWERDWVKFADKAERWKVWAENGR